MKLHEISINRPVTILMCVLIILVLGATSLMNMSLDLFPDITYPMAIVSTNYSGAAPEEIENLVTKPLESMLATVTNVKNISSTSSEGSSVINIEFNSGTDMDFASLDLREKIDFIKPFLPDDISTPMVFKFDPSMMPVAVISATSKDENISEIELKDIVEEKIKPRLESIDGVATVYIEGGETREIQVTLDPDKISGYGISMSQIVQTLKSENLNLPGGSVEFGDKKLLLRTNNEFKNTRQIENIPLTLPNGNIIYLRDIAKVEDSYKDNESYNRLNGENNIGITIQKQTNTNTVKIVRELKNAMKQISKDFPNIDNTFIFDQGDFIEKSLSNVARNGIFGAIFAILVLYIFLKNIRTTLIVGTAIPISIISTFVAMYFSGITLNMISLGGLALGIGMMVDNAIVVIENIYRHRIEGMSRKEAAKEGTGEVASAVIASTITTVIVFLPIVFTKGITAQIFREMALTVAFALGCSLVIALSFIPMLSSKYLRVNRYNDADAIKKENKLFRGFDKLLLRISKYYKVVLKSALNRRARTVIVAVALLIVSFIAIPFVGMEFFPTMDEGQIQVMVELPEGTLSEKTNETAMKAEKVIAKVPETDIIYTTVGSSGEMSFMSGASNNVAQIDVLLVDLKERNRSTGEVVDSLRKQLSTIAGANIKVSEQGGSMMGGGGKPIRINISGPNLEKLKYYSNEVLEIMESTEGTREIETSIAEARPESIISINRDKASYYGLGSYQIASLISMYVDGEVATTYKVDGDEIDVLIQMPKDEINTYEQLKSIKIPTMTGNEVLLSDIAEIKIQQGPVSISRTNQERFISVSSGVFGRDIGSVSREISQKLKDVDFVSGYSYEFTGETKEMNEAFVNLALALLLAIVLVYMVMAAQFESLIYPFIIMFSIPFAFIGSIFGLLITGRTICVPSFIGFIMLAGIVVNNAIVLVDYINTLRRRGINTDDAIKKAGETRLRPILMTSLTTILALFPLALGIGEGSETQAPLATVVIGGLLSSTLITLVLIPAAYKIVDNKLEKRKLKKASKRNKKVTNVNGEGGTI